MASFALTIKWSGQEFSFAKDDFDDSLEAITVQQLKYVIFQRTGVESEGQKLIGLKAGGKPANDETKLVELDLKPNTKVMMVGSRKEVIENFQSDQQQQAQCSHSVINDLDIPEEAEIPIANREEYLAKIAKRIKEYKVTIFNEPRPGKKLLVLDIDYTLFDHKSVAEHASQLMRPYLHEFLTSAYENYDIIIWSATGMKWIEVKMRELGVANNPNYKIVCYLDSMAMISVNAPNYGVLNVKPLGVIWGKYNQYSPKNTIMFDDVRRNFIMNPQSGVITVSKMKDLLKQLGVTEEELTANPSTPRSSSSMIHNAIYLFPVAIASMSLGFFTTLGLAKKKDSNQFQKGLVGEPGMEPGARLAFRALGRGTIWAVGGCSIIGALLYATFPKSLLKNNQTQK